MSSNFSYSKLGLRVAMEQTKADHNGIGYKEFMALYREYAADPPTKTIKEIMAAMNIKSYITATKLLNLAAQEENSHAA